jgi:choline dehydrogenase-like flavoprotein
MSDNRDGDTINLSGQFHGAVYVKSTLSGVINNVSQLPGTSPVIQDEIKQALERLSALLQALPEGQSPVAKKIADSAKDVVEAAAQPGSDKSFFEGCADTLKTWADKVGATVPAVVSAIDALIFAVGKVRGWF